MKTQQEINQNCIKIIMLFISNYISLGAMAIIYNSLQKSKQKVLAP